MNKNKSKNEIIKHEGIVRGGQRIYAKNADLLIIGDVKTNSEVIADGSIIILGKLEGKAVAGASKDFPNTKIIVEKFKPSFVSINGIYKIYEDDHGIQENVIIELNEKNEIITANY